MFTDIKLSSTALGIKRGNILLSNSYPRFPNNTTSVILSEIRLVFLQKTFRNASDGLEIISTSCFYLSCLCSFATYFSSRVIPSIRQAFTTKPEQNVADIVSFQYLCSSHKITSTQMNKWWVRKQFKRCNAYRSSWAQVISMVLDTSQRSSTLISCCLLNFSKLSYFLYYLQSFSMSANTGGYHPVNCDSLFIQ